MSTPHDPLASTIESDDLAVTPADGERDLGVAGGGGTRISALPDVVSVPAVWLDRLLSLLGDLPYEQGEAAVAQVLARSLERLFPDVEVAVQLATLDQDRSPTTGHRRMQWTEPPKSKERLRSARAFPSAPFERWVVLPGQRLGALHFACQRDLFTADPSPHVEFMDRAAGVVAQALARARAEERATVLLTELRAVEAQMVQTEKLASLGQIAAGMVHELNNPLTSIAAYSDFLIRRGTARGSDEDDLERLRRIAESASRMLRFTRDLVSYARPPADVPIAVQLNVVVDRALAFCEHEITGAGVTVERLFAAELRPVRGLPEQLAQVFVNLFTNACHAMACGANDPPRTSVLTITTSQTGDRITIVVADTGSGIAKDNLTLVFAPFFTTKAAGQGTGLGLSIVKKIVEGHGGEIAAESDPGVGTRFVLTFPVA